MKWFWLLLLTTGGLGSLARYSMTSTINNYVVATNVAGTFTVNVVGCFAFGLLYALFDRYAIASSYRSLFLTGFLGGFTTFSAFAGESMHLLLSHHYVPTIAYILISNVCSLSAAWVGYALMHAIG